MYHCCKIQINFKIKNSITALNHKLSEKNVPTNKTLAEISPISPNRLQYAPLHKKALKPIPYPAYRVFALRGQFVKKCP
jgi:hypothetical protein